MPLAEPPIVGPTSLTALEERVDHEGKPYAVVMPAATPARAGLERARLLRAFCPEGHEKKAKPGDLCERCGLIVPEPTTAERLTAKFCPKGCTRPNAAGACSRCGKRLGPPHPNRG